MIVLTSFSVKVVKMLAIVRDLSENRTFRRIQRTKYRFALYCEFTRGDPNIKIEHVSPYFLGQFIYVALYQCIITHTFRCRKCNYLFINSSAMDLSHNRNAVDSEALYPRRLMSPYQHILLSIIAK